MLFHRISRYCLALVFALFMHAAMADTFTVFAAASLKDALDDVIKTYQEKTGDKVVVSYAASSALAKQIESGAPADIFISADLDWMDYLDKRNLIKTGTRANLLRNRIVLIAPVSSTASVKIAPNFPLATLLGSDRLSMADPDSVPAGKYGKAALESLGVWKDVQSKVAPGQDVRAALVLVARREAPFGIVYKTDALIEKGVRIVDTFPESAHPPIIYPAALIATSKSAGAENFVKALNQAPARATFEKYGFN